jgi:NADPH2:quinone reductase
MKAIRVEKQGGPEVLKLLDVAPLDAPGPGQALVRIVAAGVNFVDVGQRRGTYPRQVPLSRWAWKARAWSNPLAKVCGA